LTQKAEKGFKKMLKNEKLFEKDDPEITLVKNPKNNKFTLTLQNWDLPETVDGYNEREAEQLIEMLERGIKFLKESKENRNQRLLFEELTNEKKRVGKT